MWSLFIFILPKMNLAHLGIAMQEDPVESYIAIFELGASCSTQVFLASRWLMIC